MQADQCDFSVGLNDFEKFDAGRIQMNRESTRSHEIDSHCVRKFSLRTIAFRCTVHDGDEKVVFPFKIYCASKRSGLNPFQRTVILRLGFALTLQTLHPDHSSMLRQPIHVLAVAALLGSAFLGLITASNANAAESFLQAATFRTDVTPEVGDGPCVGCMPKVTSVEHPLELRGIVLRVDERTFVIAAIDYCGICNTSDETIRGAMARAAGTTIDCVALQSLHQHSAPILDADAVRLLHGEKSEQLAQHLKFTDDIASRTSAAITDSLKQLQPVTKIVGSKAKVDRVAANRRVPQPDGSIAVRASVTREAAVRDAPEGLIDPWLRTLTFFDGDRKLVQLHYYATHPQTFYGDARVSWDSVGIARGRMEKSSGVFQIYFTGCGGNVTMGKYNDGNRESRELMATRLLDAMQRSSSADADSIANTVDVASLKPSNIQWDSAPIEFTVREEGTFNPELLKTQLDPDQPFTTRLTAAMFSGFGQRLRDGYIAQATRLRIGNIDVVNLPGEPFVEFQLFAQQVAVKDSFICVAGYGECGVWYYGPDSIFTDRGGYEQTWSLTGPCQQKVEEALTTLLVRETLPK
jgi:hypothetical protein